MSHTDHYKVLQVDPEAEAEVVQAAYRRLARKYHPDVAESPEAAARMAAINAAWAVLKDPARRAAYDTQRAGAGHAGATRPHAAPPSVPHRHTAASESPAQPPHRARPPEETSPNWTSGRSSAGSGYDPASMGTPAGHGAAGPPPRNPPGGGPALGLSAAGGGGGGGAPPAATSSTWSGSTACRSGASTARRSIASFAPRVVAPRPPPSPSGEAC